MKKGKEKKEKNNKFIEIIKKKWIVNTSMTTLLVAIVIACFIGITVLMQKLDLTPIDLTEEKLFTLSQESKDQVKDIDKDVNVYFIGFDENDSTFDLAKEYNKVNEKINVEAINLAERPDISQKYEIEDGLNANAIIVESGEKFKIISSYDLYSYDYEQQTSVSVAEEKVTAAIKSVTSDKVPQVYFLNGYSSFSLSNGMQYLGVYLQNEVNEIKTLNILSEGKVPDDCDTLVILTPEKDYDDITTNAIVDYINKGGNILWLNAAIAKAQDTPNVNKILALYGIKPFEVGTIIETDSSKMVAGIPSLIIPETQYSDVTKKLLNSQGAILLNATKINAMNDDELKTLNVTKTDLLKTSDKAFFRKDFNISSEKPQEGENLEVLTVGAQFDKIITEKNEENGTKEIASKLIIYGENYFVSDQSLDQSTQTAMILYGDNKDLFLNSIAYLTDREEDITVRKSKGTVKYTATEQENKIILAIITMVPLIIIVVGIIVSIERKRKK